MTNDRSDKYSLGFVRYLLAKSVGTLNLSSPITIMSTQSVGDALKLLKEHNIGCVVVVDGEGRVTGMFTERDALNKVCGEKSEVLEAPIAEFMTPNPNTEPTTCSVAHALFMMSGGNYRHIPIVDSEGFPISILSIRDVLTHMSDSLDSYLDTLGTLFGGGPPKSEKTD